YQPVSSSVCICAPSVANSLLLFQSNPPNPRPHQPLGHSQLLSGPRRARNVPSPTWNIGGTFAVGHGTATVPGGRLFSPFAALPRIAIHPTPRPRHPFGRFFTMQHRAATAQQPRADASPPRTAASPTWRQRASKRAISQPSPLAPCPLPLLSLPASPNLI